MPRWAHPRHPQPGQFCPVCSSEVDEFTPGPGGNRPHATCPSCGSLERHRFLVLLLQQLRAWLGGPGRILEVAPYEPLRRFLTGSVGSRYTSIDIARKTSPRVLTDLTRLGFADGIFDLVVAYHVLEHIPDDAAAMSELARTLSPKGLIVIQVPYAPGKETEEALDAGPEELEARFGQYDHVRLYGKDFTQRLYDNGLIASMIRPGDILDEEAMRRFGLIAHETSWICQIAAPLTAGTASATAGRSGRRLSCSAPS